MKYGEIVNFTVSASCPHCTEETELTQDELLNGYVQCMHCEGEFKVILSSN